MGPNLTFELYNAFLIFIFFFSIFYSVKNTSISFMSFMKFSPFTHFPYVTPKTFPPFPRKSSPNQEVYPWQPSPSCGPHAEPASLPRGHDPAPIDTCQSNSLHSRGDLIGDLTGPEILLCFGTTFKNNLCTFFWMFPLFSKVAYIGLEYFLQFFAFSIWLSKAELDYWRRITLNLNIFWIMWNLFVYK